MIKLIQTLIMLTALLFLLIIVKSFTFPVNIIIILIFYIFLKLNYPKLRGLIGELYVRLNLFKLPKEYYKVFNDLMFEDETGTHQIDHLIVSKYGIFVIETKNYYGYIKGDDYKDKWIQYLGGNKYYFHNPINQNYGHVKVLEKILNVESSIFIPIVCFGTTANLNVNSKHIVINSDLLIKTIKSFYKPLLDTNLNDIIKTINENNITDKEKRKQHVKQIKNKIIQDNEKVNNMICPRCGNELVLKNSKYGTFKGCSNYPKCKYKKK